MTANAQENLPGTKVLVLEGDPAVQMVEGIHSFVDRETVLRVVKESSGTEVELKQAAESVAAANLPALGTQRCVWRREEEKVALTLVVSFKMMMFDVFVQRPA
jgi:hypothetical protein